MRIAVTRAACERMTYASLELKPIFLYFKLASALNFIVPLHPSLPCNNRETFSFSSNVSRPTDPPPPSVSADILQVRPWILETIHGFSFPCCFSAFVSAAPRLSDLTPSLQTCLSQETRPWSPQVGKTSSWDSSDQVIPPSTTSESGTTRSACRPLLGWQTGKHRSWIGPLLS